MDNLESYLEQFSSGSGINQEALDDGFAPGMADIDTYMDIVFCIDVTWSMQPTINTVKNFATTIYDDLVTAMRERDHRVVKMLRVKVIAFRDLYCDGGCSLIESDFFKLPEDTYRFQSFVNSLEARGGGDDPESALEALAVAMRTDWVKINDINTQRARHVIVLFTDDSAHPLEQSAYGIDENYPQNIPASLNELTMEWQGQGSLDEYGNAVSMDGRAKRLVIFAPESCYPWDQLPELWENTVGLKLEKGGGGMELARDIIITMIGNTLS